MNGKTKNLLYEELLSDFPGLAAVLLLLCSLMLACDDGNGDPGGDASLQITMSGTPETWYDGRYAKTGQTVQFSANKDGVIWSLETMGQEYASGTSISSSGLLTIAADENATSITVQATAGGETHRKDVAVAKENTAAISQVDIDFADPGALAMVGSVLEATPYDSDGKLVTNATFQWKRVSAEGSTYTGGTDISGAAAFWVRSRRFRVKIIP